jgi:toxin-antitoxin system PIN domain toxin
LDINILLALSDPMHAHHEAAHHWFAEVGHRSWATCPITENGFVRIAAHPNYPNRPGDVAATISLLRGFCEIAGHSFWEDDLSIRDLLRTDSVITHAQVTDIYLLGLAAKNGGILATLDRRIPASVVQGGEAALTLIPV